MLSLCSVLQMLNGLVKRIALDFDVETIAKAAKASKEAKIAEVGADIELLTKQNWNPQYLVTSNLFVPTPVKCLWHVNWEMNAFLHLGVCTSTHKCIHAAACTVLADSFHHVVSYISSSLSIGLIPQVIGELRLVLAELSLCCWFPFFLFSPGLVKSGSLK